MADELFAVGSRSLQQRAIHDLGRKIGLNVFVAGRRLQTARLRGNRERSTVCFLDSIQVTNERITVILARQEIAA